ncbi:hypothetical protein OSTOST_12448 [Ostertagia ostertagi]
MQAVRLVLRPLLRQQRRWLCTLPSSSEDVEVKSLLPSEAFLKQFVRRPSQRDKLTSLISELQIFLEMFGKDSLPEFTDSIWSTYFGTWSAEERCEFLNQLRLERKNALKTCASDEKEQASESRKYPRTSKFYHTISVINQRKEDNGEMVYAPGFNTFIELRGQEFRAPARADPRFEEDMALNSKAFLKLLANAALLIVCTEVDCFHCKGVMKNYPSSLLTVDFSLNSVYQCSQRLLNTTSSLMIATGTPRLRLPANLSSQFRPTANLTEILKRHLLFQYGPPSSESSFSRHPFAPTLTPKDIMYISWRATQFIPDEPPPNVRAVVLCASKDYQPWSSSVSAAQQDGIQAYRLPLERYARFEGAAKYLPLKSASSVLRSYFRGDDIGESIRTAVDSQNKIARSTSKAELELFEQYKSVIQEAVAKAEKESLSTSRTKPNRSHSEPKKPKVHRYTREERRKMREQEAASSSGAL